MRTFKFLVIGIVISACILAVGYLVLTVEKIESESVVNQGMKGIVLFTTNKETSIETEKILKDMQSSLTGHTQVKVIGHLDSMEDVEAVIRDDAKDSINYNIIEFNRSSMIKEKGTVAIRIPNKDAINYKDSLERAEKIKDKSEDIKINIVESKNTPKLLNTYIGIEISDAESIVDAKKILDKLILLDQ